MTIDTRAMREMMETLSAIDLLKIDPAIVISLCDEVDRLRAPFRNADEIDWAHLFNMVPESGHGQFWKAVFMELRAALHPPKMHSGRGDG